jgi:hypothetical protein
MSDGKIIELLKITNGHLPRVKYEYEYDRVNAELYSRTTESNNAVQIYQQFVDQNISLKRREDELLLNISKLEAKERELQKSTNELQQQLSTLSEYEFNTCNLYPEIKHEEIIPNGVLIPHHTSHNFCKVKFPATEVLSIPETISQRLLTSK